MDGTAIPFSFNYSMCVRTYLLIPPALSNWLSSPKLRELHSESTYTWPMLSTFYQLADHHRKRVCLIMWSWCPLLTRPLNNHIEIQSLLGSWGIVVDNLIQSTGRREFEEGLSPRSLKEGLEIGSVYCPIFQQLRFLSFFWSIWISHFYQIGYHHKS